MPQLDIAILFNQFFWFFGVFSVAYIHMTYVIIPKINFYYFTRYNIQSAFLQLEKRMSRSVLSGDIFTQTHSEWAFVYSRRLRWFHKKARGSRTSPSKRRAVKIQNYILMFFLVEVSLGRDISI
jgi:hypothetical protein